MNKREKEIKKEIDNHNAQISALHKEQDSIDSRKTIKCKCGKRTPIKKVLVLRDHWYETPSGCTGGDMWHRSDENHWYCPHCESWQRAYIFSSSKAKKSDKNLSLTAKNWFLTQSLMSHFGEVLNQYNEKTLDEIRAANKKEKERRAARGLY